VYTKSKVVLLYPRLHFEKQHQSWTWAPLPILAVSAPLLAAGFDVTLINGEVEADWLRKVTDECADALLLGISSMSGPQIHFGLEAARAVRTAGHQLPLIWGGYHPSILPEQTSVNPYVDAVVRGQGEHTLLEIAQNLSQGEDYTDIDGITFTHDGETVSTPERKLQDISKFPRLPYEKLYNPEQYVNKMDMLGTRTINYLSSQGCPCRCQFCAEPLVYKRRWQGHTPDRVLADLEFLESSLNINGISFSDANYFVNERRAFEISAKMAENGIMPRWAANARASQLTGFSDDTFKMLGDSGLDSFFVGAETGSQQMLESLHKDIKPEDTLAAARRATSHGINVLNNFILGFPGETEQERDETWNLIDDISKIVGEYNSQMHFYAPTPGNALYDKAIDLGLEQPECLEDWSQFSTLEARLPWMNQKFINRMQQRNFYMTYGYPSGPVRTRAQKSLPNRLYFGAASSISSWRCHHQHWGLPLDWWLLQGMRQKR